MKPKILGIYSGISLAMLFWSLSFVFYKIAYRNLEPIALIFFRLIVASLFLLTVTALTGSFEKIRRADFGRFLLLSLFEPLLYFLGESYGMNLVSSTVGAVIVSTIPLLTPVAAFLFFRERITWLRIAGITLSFTGVLLVLTGRGFVLVAPPRGIALMFLAVFSAVSYTSLIVNLTRKYRSMTIILI
ncbi:MAG: DMT family transporter, partial [Bacteroidales bacterium]|nr:DMT family transporter [Bacteroidales bacterium]